ncbi:hypothetical protein BVX98_00150 [bacterium F11]|nr:hypothetical protein BVX98_00150 [bacterium F11]
MKGRKIRQFFTRRFTLMVVPHQGSGKTRQANIPLSFILTFFVAWTLITCWGSYLSARHIDYWRSQVSNKVLNLKVEYLTSQLDRSRDFLDEVKQVEHKLRGLLDYKSKYNIITNQSLASNATGGPSLRDQNEITGLLVKKGMDVSWERLIEKAAAFRSEAQHQIQSYEDLESWIQEQRAIYRATPRGWPAPGRISSPYGARTDPFTKKREYHYGIDITGPIGTPVRATGDGVIKISNWHSGYGKLIVIQHKFGYSTRYAHNGRLLVRVGDKVKRGQAIALLGNTGKSSGPHCHYEVWRYQKRHNPYAYLKGNFPKLGSETNLSSIETPSRNDS